jgi:hypothetical protein
LYRVLSGKLAAVIVVAHHAEAGVEALFGIGVTGGDRRDLGDARIVINPRSGMLVPVFQWPTTPATPLSTRRWATATAVRGSD